MTYGEEKRRQKKVKTEICGVDWESRSSKQQKEHQIIPLEEHGETRWVRSINWKARRNWGW